MRNVATVGARMITFEEHLAVVVADRFPAGILAGTSVLPDLSVTRFEKSGATGNDAVDRFADRPVGIRGVGLDLDSVMHQHKPDLTPLPAAERAARQAFGMANMTSADIHVAEVHDFFTGTELIGYEDLGFAERFDGDKLVEAEVTSVGGALPVNPNGGYQAKGRPPGATGVAQCVELFEQLRDEAANQVDGDRVALAHNVGGPTAVAAVTILEGPGGYGR